MWDVSCLNLPSDTNELVILTALEECAAGKYMLNWGKCKGVTGDSAASITGRHCGVVKRLMQAIDNSATCNQFHPLWNFGTEGYSPSIMEAIN
jgi:hypothetical protein